MPQDQRTSEGSRDRLCCGKLGLPQQYDVHAVRLNARGVVSQRLQPPPSGWEPSEAGRQLLSRVVVEVQADDSAGQCRLMGGRTADHDIAENSVPDVLAKSQPG